MKTAKDKDLRIAVIIRRFVSTGGAEKYCVELTRRLARGHQVHVFAQEFEEPGVPGIQLHPIRQRNWKPRFLNQWLFAFNTWRAVGPDFDIVHSHDMLGHADVYTLHVPCFRTRHTQALGIHRLLPWLGSLISPRELSYLLIEHRQFSSARRHKRFIAVSDYMRNNILQNYPATAGHIDLAPPGMDAARVSHRSREQRLRDRAGFGIAPETFVLLFAAHDFRKKGLSALLRAVPKLGDDCLLLIVGGGKRKAYLAQARASGIEHRLRFLGVQQSLSQLFDLADVLVHPTLVDTYGMTVLEAMAHRLPVIVSNADYCGISAQLPADTALLLSDPRDADEIAERLVEFRHDPVLQASLAENGKRLADTVTWEQTTEASLDAYHTLLAQRESAERATR